MNETVFYLIMFVVVKKEDENDKNEWNETNAKLVCCNVICSYLLDFLGIEDLFIILFETKSNYHATIEPTQNEKE
jgi:hypothetical protein